MRMIVRIAVAALAAWGAAAADADLVRLRNGRSLEGKVVEEGDRVVVETDAGRVVVSRAEVASIERRGTRAEQYEALEAELAADDKEGWLRLANWCGRNSLSEKADAAFRRVIELDPDHEEARKALGFSRVEEEWIPGAWKEHRTPHFVWHSLVEPTAIEARARLVQSLYETFSKETGTALPEGRSFRVVVFDDRQTYRTYMLAHYPDEKDKFENPAVIARGFADRGRNRVLTYYDRKEKHVDLVCDFVVAHEATHVLAGSLLWDGKKGPLWLEEGLADYCASWKYDRGVVRAHEVDHANGVVRGKIKVLREALVGDKWPTLANLLDLEKFQFEKKFDVNVLYTASWSLVYYMNCGEDRALRPGFETFLKRVAEDKATPQDLEECLGKSLPEIEKGWKMFLGNLEPE